MNVHRGKIIALQGSYMSGLATLIIDDVDLGTQMIHCENGQTVRSFEDAFGDVIGNAHSIKEDGGHVGKEIYYSVDWMNILEAFTPVDEASEKLVEMYEKERKETAIV